jgi:hypothetical protein
MKPGPKQTNISDPKGLGLGSWTQSVESRKSKVGRDIHAQHSSCNLARQKKMGGAKKGYVTEYGRAGVGLRQRPLYWFGRVSVIRR